MDTTNTDIREEIPEGYVSTQDVITAFREVGEKVNWCGTERHYLEQTTDIRFGRQVWDRFFKEYVPVQFDKWAVTEDTPHAVPKAHIVRTLRAGIEGHPYEARKGVAQLASMLGLDFELFNDTFEITITIDFNGLLDVEDDLNVDDDSIEDTDVFARALREVMRSMLFNRDGYISLQNNEAVESGRLRLRRVPDPARSKVSNGSLD